MITIFVAAPFSSCWHILRPNDPDRVWCQGTVDRTTWTQITLYVPPSVCPACLDAETLSVTNDLDRVPALASVF